MKSDCLEFGTRVGFYQDGLAGTGVIRRVIPTDDYCYYVQVETCEDDEDYESLHSCWDFFGEDVGWAVTRSGITAVFGYADEPQCSDIDESELESLLCQ